MKRRRVVLAYLYPVGRDQGVPHRFMDSVIRVLEAAPQLGFDIARCAAGSGPLIATARNRVVEWFLQDGAFEYLWWVDTDMVFTPDVLPSLVAAHKPIVSALCRVQNEDGSTHPAALVRDDGKLRPATDDDITDRYQKVAVVGMACTMIEKRVLEALGTAPLWPYAEAIDEVTHQATGEDATFCQRASRKGFETFVRTDVKVGHQKSIVL